MSSTRRPASDLKIPIWFRHLILIIWAAWRWWLVEIRNIFLAWNWTTNLGLLSSDLSHGSPTWRFGMHISHNHDKLHALGRHNLGVHRLGRPSKRCKVYHWTSTITKLSWSIFMLKRLWIPYARAVSQWGRWRVQHLWRGVVLRGEPSGGSDWMGSPRQHRG